MTARTEGSKLRRCGVSRVVVTVPALHSRSTGASLPLSRAGRAIALGNAAMPSPASAAPISAVELRRRGIADAVRR